MQQRFVSTLLEVAGGIVGGIVGYYAFVWLVHQNFYGLMLPGALIGLGCGLLARHRSMIRGLICAVAALGLELYAEWKHFPFVKDESFGFMVAHFHEKAPIKIIMFAAGALLAFWLGKDAGFGNRVDPRRGGGPDRTEPARGS